MKKLEEMATPPPSRPRTVRLETARDCRKFLSRLINRTYRDEIDASKASRIGFLVGVLIKSIELTNIEQRISEMEKKMGAHRGTPTSA